MTERTLADDLRDEEERFRRQFVYLTRKKGPLTVDEAMQLADMVRHGTSPDMAKDRT